MGLEQGTRRVHAEAEYRSIPWYQQFEWEMRNDLDWYIDRVDLQKPRRFAGVESLFRSAKAVVDQGWIPAMTDRREELESHLVFDHRKTHGLRSVITNPLEFRKMLRSNEVWKLEELSRLGGEEVWIASSLGLSLRYQELARVAKKWVSEMTGNECRTQLGFSKPVMLLYIDLNLAIQSDVDHLYMRELELELDPDERRKTPYFDHDGSQYVYLQRTGKGKNTYQAIPFRHKFSEISSIARTFRTFATRVALEVRTKSLPATMRGFDGYLRQYADALESDSIRFSSLDLIWKSVSKKTAKMARQGCPILVNAAGFCNEKGQIVHDVLIGLQQKNISWMYDTDRIYHIALQRAKYDGFPGDIEPVINQDIHIPNGISNAWMTSAITGDGYILTISNESDFYSARTYERHSDMLFDSISKERYTFARALALVAHEFGHLAPQLRKWMTRRLGAGLSLNKFDELKADMKGAVHILKYLREKRLTAKEYIQTYLLEYIDHIAIGYGSPKDSSYAWYAFSGTVILSVLFRAGAIGWVGNKLRVIDAEKGIAAMAREGEILMRMYKNTKLKKKDLQAYVRASELMVYNDPDTQYYIELACRKTGLHNDRINKNLLRSLGWI